ncbi:hypothetical protein ACFL03_13350, partial [Thermodesulfobacteriota bacterium]
FMIHLKPKTLNIPKKIEIQLLWICSKAWGFGPGNGSPAFIFNMILMTLALIHFSLSSQF